MLVIRLQRTGRKGHAMFRVVVQDSRRTPTSGKVVARLGSYDPHSKAVIIDKDKASFYLEHGAQPSGRIVNLLIAEGVTMPDWVRVAAQKQRSVRNADKRRSTRPPEPVKEVEAAAEETTGVQSTPTEEIAEPETDSKVPKAEEPAESITENPETTTDIDAATTKE
jgi:small subunit ribosomal protein S16